MSGKIALLIAGGFFAIFAANVVIGKIAIVNGATTTPGLGDVGEFLVLFAAVVFFIIACLFRERADSQKNQNQTTE